MTSPVSQLWTFPLHPGCLWSTDSAISQHFAWASSEVLSLVVWSSRALVEDQKCRRLSYWVGFQLSSWYTQWHQMETLPLVNVASPCQGHFRSNCQSPHWNHLRLTLIIFSHQGKVAQSLIGENQRTNHPSLSAESQSASSAWVSEPV